MVKLPRQATIEYARPPPLTLHAPRQTPQGASCLVLARSTWSVKTRRAPSRRCRDARVYGHTTTGMHDNEALPNLTRTTPTAVVGAIVQLHRYSFRQAFEEQHDPEAAAELMCSWAADSSKLLRPLSRMVVQGVDTTSFVDVDSWLLAMRSWLELEDTLQVRSDCVVGGGCGGGCGGGGGGGGRGGSVVAVVVVVVGGGGGQESRKKEVVVSCLLWLG